MHEHVQTRDSGKFGCRVIFPDNKKSELDLIVYLPDEFLADTEDEAKQSGSLAGLHKIAGVPSLQPRLYSVVSRTFMS